MFLEFLEHLKAESLLTCADTGIPPTIEIVCRGKIQLSASRLTQERCMRMKGPKFQYLQRKRREYEFIKHFIPLRFREQRKKEMPSAPADRHNNPKMGTPSQHPQGASAGEIPLRYLRGLQSLRPLGLQSGLEAQMPKRLADRPRVRFPDGNLTASTWFLPRSLASHNRHEASLLTWLLTCDGLDVLNFGPKLHHMDPPSIPLCFRFDFDPTSPCFSRLAALRYPLTPQYVASVWAGYRRPNFWPVHSGCGTTSCGPSRSCRAQSDVDLDLE